MALADLLALASRKARWPEGFRAPRAADDGTPDGGDDGPPPPPPALVIDLATLTGGAISALSKGYGGAFFAGRDDGSGGGGGGAPQEALRAIVDAGAASGERRWPFVLVREPVTAEWLRRDVVSQMLSLY